MLPSDFGINNCSASDLAGHDPIQNALVVKDVLNGKGSRSAHYATTMNAGAAVYLAGLAETLKEAIEKAEAALDEGKGAEVLQQLRAAGAQV